MSKSRALSSAVIVPELPDGQRLEPTHPRALDKEIWLNLPEEQREEALERAAWLAFRGNRIGDVLAMATEGMRQDEAQMEFPTHWGTILAVAHHWNSVRRSPNGRYVQRILDLAEKIERQANAEAIEAGAVDDPVCHFMGYLPYPGMIEHAVRIYEDRVLELRAQAQAKIELYETFGIPAP